jgi:hypothetical protein
VRSAEVILAELEKLDAEMADMPGAIRSSPSARAALRERKATVIAEHLDGMDYT